MYTVGLTGGIGSGKSLVAEIFTHLGIPVFNADQQSKLILDQDIMVKNQLTDWFGAGIYQNNQVDRQKLARIIFNDAPALLRMNELMHPLVMERFIKWCRQNHESPYVIHEAAILFESGFYHQMSTSILVTAPETIRIERVMHRDKASKESIRLRIQSQWTDEQKLLLAGFIINNDGKSPILPRVLEIHNKLIEQKAW